MVPPLADVLDVTRCRAAPTAQPCAATAPAFANARGWCPPERPLVWRPKLIEQDAAFSSCEVVAHPPLQLVDSQPRAWGLGTIYLSRPRHTKMNLAILSARVRRRRDGGKPPHLISSCARWDDRRKASSTPHARAQQKRLARHAMGLLVRKKATCICPRATNVTGVLNDCACFGAILVVVPRGGIEPPTP